MKANGDTDSSRRSSTSSEISLSDIEAVKAEKFRIMKNILLICVAFLFNFTAFGGISNLQSSLNDEEGLGTTSLAIIYAALIFSALFTPTFNCGLYYFIKKIGCKWTICGAILGYTTYSLGNFYPTWGTLIPTSIIVGLSGAPLWSAKCAYLTTSAKRYARLTGDSVDSVVNKFFGIFFLFFQLNQIAGNLISSFVLSTANSTSLEFPDEYNATRIETYCGSNDCQNGDGKDASEDDDIPESTIYTLMGIYTAVGLTAAAIVAFLVDRITLRQDDGRNTKQLLVATFKHMKDKRQIILILITMYSGFEQAFVTGDYTQSFVSCPLAVNWVGFVMICFGACDSVFSFLFGRVEKYTGRLPLFSLAMLINIALIITFLVWIPYPNNAALFFILPAFWGIADAVWQTQLNSLYGVIFFGRQEESFANYRLWESVGFVIAFGYQSYVCVYVKLYVLLGVLLSGMSGYYYVEYTERKHGTTDNITISEGSSNEAYQEKEDPPDYEKTNPTTAL